MGQLTRYSTKIGMELTEVVLGLIPFPFFSTVVLFKSRLFPQFFKEGCHKLILWMDKIPHHSWLGGTPFGGPQTL